MSTKIQKEQLMYYFCLKCIFHPKFCFLKIHYPYMQLTLLGLPLPLQQVSSMTPFIIIIYEARNVNGHEFLDKVENYFRLTLNITFHPPNLIIFLTVLMCFEHQTENINRCCNKFLKWDLKRVNQDKGFFNEDSEKLYQVCKYVKDSKSLQYKVSQSIKIKGENNCNSKMIVYLVNCKCCQQQYVGSTSTRFRLRFNNYKSCHNRGRRVYYIATIVQSITQITSDFGQKPYTSC